MTTFLYISMLPAFGFLLEAAVTSGGLAWAWNGWARAKPHFEAPFWRSYLAFLGLIVVSAQAVLFIAIEIYAWRIGGWSKGYPTLFAWGRIDFYIFLFVVLSTAVGKGGFRFGTLVSKLAMTAIWWAIAF